MGCVAKHLGLLWIPPSYVSIQKLNRFSNTMLATAGCPVLEKLLCGDLKNWVPIPSLSFPVPSSFPCPQLLLGSQGLCELVPHLLDLTLGTSSSRQPYYTVFPPPQKFFLVLKDPQEENIHVFPFISRHGADTPRTGEGGRQMDTKLERISYSGDGTNKVLRLRM